VAQHTLAVDFTIHDVHRVRNFGEDLWRALRDDRSATASLDEIDSATTRMHVVVRSTRQLKRVSKLIEGLLAEHNLSTVATLLEVDRPPYPVDRRGRAAI
jgi:hypothetical protein